MMDLFLDSVSRGQGRGQKVMVAGCFLRAREKFVVRFSLLAIFTSSSPLPTLSRWMENVLALLVSTVIYQT
jgi:hypothetical protein